MPELIFPPLVSRATLYITASAAEVGVGVASPPSLPEPPDPPDVVFESPDPPELLLPPSPDEEPLLSFADDIELYRDVLGFLI